ncbi:MAG: aminopeptidase [Pigmentiphaga sp.]|uniref:aminopeptidase n=1 Tax=Pigmentiphaga sp. TaxID=1977564 RepID=UPI0029A198B0|nr:aminopeptidase [Pigmentiphaga sp.]MDX3906833.1 aminopeptidase [Pigmentiphaga sp.]
MASVTTRARRAGLYGLCALGAAWLLAGCANLEYYAQSIAGHSSLLQAARPLDRILADPATPEDLRTRLRYAHDARRFASEQLGLPDNDSYTKYADLKRPYVVWNVFATPELSLRLKQSCFLVVGCLDYRGYYREDDARRAAAALREQGWEVHVGGVPAYSTLGWYPDPLVNTFIRLPPGEVARLVFHELTHQAVYAKNDTAFNESLATAVEQIAVERWLEQPGNQALRPAYEAYDRRRRDFIALLLETRRQLAQAYGEAGPRQGRAPTTPEPAGLSSGEIERRRARKAEIIADLRQRYERLKHEKWNGYAGYDAWFAQPLNNAHFAAIGTYHQWVPALRAMAGRCGSCATGSLAPFLEQARELARLPYAERRKRLREETERVQGTQLSSAP